MSLTLVRADAPAREQHPHRWAALVVLCAAALIINLDNTILNVALPTLVRDLHATSSQLQWIVDSYAMVFAGLLLVGGSLADRFGRKRFFLIGLTVFAAGSIGAALSGSVDLLIAFRAVMGAGAALTIPSSLSIINDVFRDPKERAKAIGAWGGTIGLGIAIGPIAGGLLLARFWWGSIFLVNVPIVIAAFVGAVLFVPNSKNPAADRPDPGGAILSILGLGLLLWSIIEGPSQGWTSPRVIVAGSASLVVLGSFVAWEAHSPHPMLKLAFFSRTEILNSGGGRVPRGLRPPGRAVPADAVSPVRSRQLTPPSRTADLADGRHARGERRVVPVHRPLHRGQVHRRRRPGGRSRAACGRSLRPPVRDDLRGRLARAPADRPRRRAPAPDGDQLRRGLGPSGRLRDGVGDQRRGPPGRRCARRGGHRQRGLDPLPGSHDDWRWKAGTCPPR